jgi:uncharacterized protein (AIM24 family)
MSSRPSPWSHAARPGVADDIDFEIKGEELQFVEIELDPGESAVAEAGAFVWKDASVQMTTVFGDGSGDDGGGLMGKLLGAGKRLVTGESLFTTVFTHAGHGKARVAFASPTPGAILPLKLSEIGGEIICQKDSFLAAAKGVQIGIAFQRRILTGLFGGEGFIMQRLTGDGWVFVQMGGTVTERVLGPGEQLHVDTGCLAASGKVWVQSLPFSRLAGRMLAAAGSRGGQNRGQDSLLGPLGDFIGGNN